MVETAPMRTALNWLSWPTALILTLVLVLRLTSSLGTPNLVAIAAVSPLALPFAALPLTVAIAGRSKMLGAISATCLIAGCLLIAQDFARPRAAVTPTGPVVRIATANIQAGNPDPGQAFTQSAASGASIVLLQEIEPASLARIEATVAAKDFPHRVLDAREGFYGSAIFSRLPIEGDVIWVNGWPMTEAVFALEGESIRIINVHTVAPTTNASVTLWRRQFAELADIARSASGPLIIAGDFNATNQHRPLRSLAESGLDDAFIETGTGVGATWPVGSIVPRPLFRLDRVLITDDIRALGHHHGAPNGSDHLPIYVDLELRESG